MPLLRFLLQAFISILWLVLHRWQQRRACRNFCPNCRPATFFSATSIYYITGQQDIMQGNNSVCIIDDIDLW